MSASGPAMWEEDPDEIQKQRASLAAENIQLKLRINLYEGLLGMLDGVDELESLPEEFWKFYEVYKLLKGYKP